MKRFLAFVLCALLAASLCSCKLPSSAPEVSSEAAASSSLPASSEGPRRPARPERLQRLCKRCFCRCGAEAVPPSGRKVHLYRYCTGR